MVLGIYRRVSTEDQSNKGLSLDNQALRGKELALKLGFEYKIFTDAGLSGTIPFDKRPGLNSLLNEVTGKKIQAIFITDLDRLSREGVIQTTLIKNILKENNVRLFDINQEIDLNDINQDLLTDIKVLLAAFETKKTSARIKSVLEKSVRDGRASGGPLMPFGYTKDKDKKLIIDNEEAKIVKYIYQLAIEGKGTKIISSILNKEKILTKRGRVQMGSSMMVRGKKKESFVWRDAVVYRVLTNPIYKGERLYKENTYSSPAIIERETFNLVQEQLKSRSQFKNTTNKYEYLLKGLIVCPVCNRRFNGHKRADGKDNAYICSSKRYSGESCGNVGINIDFLNELVMKSIRDFDKVVDAAFDDVRKDNFLKSVSERIEFNDKLIKENRTAIENLLDITERAGISATSFKGRFNKLNNRLIFLQKENKLLMKKESVLKDEKPIKQIVKNGLSKFNQLSFIEQQNFIRNLITKIYVRWRPETLAHLITIDFRIDKLQNYLMSKELLINRTSGRGKRITKILDEKILIKKIYEDGSNDSFSIKYVE